MTCGADSGQAERARASDGVAAEGGAVIAEAKHVFNLCAQHCCAERQTASDALCGRHNVGLNTVIHICVKLARTSVTRLHLVNYQKNIFRLCKLGKTLNEFLVES